MTEKARAGMARVLGLELALLAAEVELLEELIAKGILPPGARRTPTAPELRAGVRFAELDRIVNDAAALITRKADRVRDHVLDGLAENLAGTLAQPDPWAALEDLARLTDPTDPAAIAGLADTLRVVEDEIAADLTATARAGYAEALDEGRRQGLPDRLLPTAGDAATDNVQAAARAHAKAVAQTPATRLLDVAAKAGANAATIPGATGGSVVEAALDAAEQASRKGIEDAARQAANVTHGLGRAEAQAGMPDPREVYASELLDRNTCGPCATVDGRTYESLEAGLVDYPGAGGYVGCDGGARCRGTLVLVHKTEARPTLDNPGSGPGAPGGPADRTPRGPSGAPRPDYIDAAGNVIPQRPDVGVPAQVLETPGLDVPIENGRTVMPTEDLEPPITTVAPQDVDRDPELARFRDDELDALMLDPAEPFDRKMLAADELDQRNAGNRAQVWDEEAVDAATLEKWDREREAWEAAGGSAEALASYVPQAAGAAPKGRAIDRVRDSWAEELELAYIRAEDATHGYLISRERAAEYAAKYGTSTAPIFEGPARVAYYYSSRELRDHWEAIGGRPTFAEYAVERGITDAKTRSRAAAAARARNDAALAADGNAAGRAKRAAQRAEKAKRKAPMTAGDRLALEQRRRDRIRAQERKAAAQAGRDLPDVPTPIVEAPAPIPTPAPAPVAPPPPVAAPIVAEPVYVDRIADAIRSGRDTVPNLERVLASPDTAPLPRANIRAALDKIAAEEAEAAAQRAAAGKVADRVAIPAEVLETLLPKRGGWTTTTRAKAVETLKASPQGRQLLKTVDSFQSGGSTAIPRLRTDVEKYLAGAGDLTAGRIDAIENLLSAIGNSTYPHDAKALYRGMVIPGDVDDVLAKYASGSPLDLSISSFSSDKALAQGFSERGAGKKVTTKNNTPVLVEWVGEAKKALPIENLGKSGVFAKEREWVAAGRYVVDGSRKVTRNGVDTVVVTIRQIEVW